MKLVTLRVIDVGKAKDREILRIAEGEEVWLSAKDGTLLPTRYYVREISDDGKIYVQRVCTECHKPL